LAGNPVKPLLSLYGIEWRERGYGLSPLQPDINLTSTPPTGWPEASVYPTHITRVGAKTFLQIDQYNFLFSNFFPSLWQTNLGTLRIIFFSKNIHGKTLYNYNSLQYKEGQLFIQILVAIQGT
jgi:hypothetical protein